MKAKTPYFSLRPTRLGVTFLGLILLTLIGCINYSLSLGFMLTFLLGGLWILTSTQASRALRGLNIKLYPPSDLTAGDSGIVSLQLQQENTAGTLLLLNKIQQGEPDSPQYRLVRRFYIPKNQIERVDFTLPLLVRGPLKLSDWRVICFDHLGLWQASARLPEHDLSTLVNPAAAPFTPPPSHLNANGADDSQQRRKGQEDFLGVRPYISGDTPRLISWKHAARTGKLMTREFDAPSGEAIHIDWQATQDTAPTEQRLAQMAAWIEYTRQNNQPFQFTLPGTVLPLDISEQQTKTALQALAKHKPWPETPNPQRPKPSRRQQLIKPKTTALPASSVQFSLLALLIAFLPSFLRQPIWISVVMLGMLAYSYFKTIPERKLPTIPSIGLFGIAVIMGFLLNNVYGILLGREAGTAILGVLIALKSAETRTVRDAKLLSLLGIFLTSTHFFHNQGPLTAIHSILAILFLTTALGRWMPPMQDVGHKLSKAVLQPPELRKTGRLMLLAAPMAVLLFMFFPRPEGPLWQLPIQSGAQTGLSDEISAGEFSNLAQSDAVAFRADFEGGQIPDSTQRYWRGPVYELFDGRKWTRARNRFTKPSVEWNGPTRRYTLTLEPNGKPWLLTLDVPTRLPSRSFITTAFQGVTYVPPSTRTRYLIEMRSATIGRIENTQRLNLNLLLPQGQNPRALALAKEWRNLPPTQRVIAAKQFLATGGYRYTLDPPILPPTNRIDAFLYDSKLGFCEHYASTFAFLMRASGVPARIVGGYMGGEVNPNGRYLIVRQQDAHAWNEVWLQGQGWVRVDPTAIIAPARVNTDLGTALAQPNATSAAPKTTIGRLMLQADALQNQWNTWVVGYNGEQQRSLLARVGIGNVGSSAYMLTLAILASLLIIPSLWFLRRVARPKDPAEHALLVMSERLRLPREPSETISDYAARATEEHPALIEPLQRFVKAYHQARYGLEQNEQQAQQLLQLARQISPSKQASHKNSD